MFEDKYNSKQLFLNEKFGLQRVYQALAKNNINGISLEDFDNLDKISINDLSFANLLRQNFNNINTDKNDVISRQELSQLLTAIDKNGLTYEQLYALSAQGIYTGESKTLLSTVMENFNKIDTNHDGRVSEAEINSYKFNKEIEDKKKELFEFKASNISFFYDGSSSSTDSTDSITVNKTSTK